MRASTCNMLSLEIYTTGINTPRLLFLGAKLFFFLFLLLLVLKLTLISRDRSKFSLFAGNLPWSNYIEKVGEIRLIKCLIEIC